MINTETFSARRGRKSKDFQVLEGGEPSAGRTLPHSLEAEECLLSCCLIDGAATIERCRRARLKPEHFYSPANHIIYEVMGAIRDAGHAVDIAVLAEELKGRKVLETVGGYQQLAQISGRVPTTGQAPYFLEKVVELAILRRIIREGTGTVEASFDYQGDLAAFTGAIATRFTAIADYVTGRLRQTTQTEAAALAREDALDVAHGRVDKSRWLHFPWPKMDTGFLPVDVRQEDWFNIVAAPPSGGKSTYLRLLAAPWLEAGKVGVVFLLETSRKRWIQALAASFAGVDLRMLEETRALFPDRFADFTGWLDEIEAWMEQRLWIFDDVVALEDIVRVTRELDRTLREKQVAGGKSEAQAHGLDFVIGDYLQIVTTRRQFLKRTEELAHICRSLKQLHRGIDVPGFWGAQITREARNAGRRPHLADLGESKALEEAADRVQFLHEPTDGNDAEAPGEKSTATVEVIQRKSRNGPKDVLIELEFNRPLSRMSDASHKQPVGASRAKQAAPTQPTGKVDKAAFMKGEDAPW